MAETRFDLQVHVSHPKEVRGFTEDEKNTLFAQPKVDSKKAKQAGIAPVAKEEPQELELTLEEISEGYSELLERANSVLEALEERAENLTYFFDPDEELQLANAVASTFQGKHDCITYTMYLAALKLDKDLATLVGEIENGSAG